jgi:hypothetical protein
MTIDIQRPSEEARAAFEEFLGFSETPFRDKALFMNVDQPKVAENPNEKIGVARPIIPEQ